MGTVDIRIGSCQKDRGFRLGTVEDRFDNSHHSCCLRAWVG